MIKTLKTKRKNVIKKIKHYIKTHSIKRVISLVVFFILTIGLLVHSVILTLFYIDNDHQYKIYNFTYIDAILSDQDTTQPMRTSIVRIHKFSFDTIKADNQIVMCCDFDTDENFVHYVDSIDKDNETLETSYTGIVTSTLTEDAILGIYEKDANFFGTIYYTAMFTQGYILLVLSHMLLGLGYYYIFIFDNPDRFFKKNLINTKKDQKKVAS